jgi:hypothetical protein
MTKNNKGRVPVQNPTRKTADSRNHTVTDPLMGWFNLVKPSRDRLQKRSWKRGRK